MTGGVDMIWKRLAERRVSGVQGQKNFESGPHCSRGMACNGQCQSGQYDNNRVGSGRVLHIGILKRNSERLLTLEYKEVFPGLLEPGQI